MKPLLSSQLETVLDRARTTHFKIYGEVRMVDGMVVKIAGLSGFAKLGDTIRIQRKQDEPLWSEVIAIDGDMVIALSYGALEGVGVGGAAILVNGRNAIHPDASWLGRTLDPFARPLDDGPLLQGDCAYPLVRPAIRAVDRRLLGERLTTGYSVFDTFLPLCRGQRLGVFAGSGVGKSILLGGLVNRVECDAVVVALIGERGREVRSFIDETLSAAGRARSTIVVSTADQSPLAKKRAAHAAMAVAEKLRDDGQQVLLIFDSLTRYAEAHREAALAAGETPSLHAFPPSTFRAVASLVERAGPGMGAAGDITAIFSVLVAGSDTDEPAADMIRGILDGHVVLERDIAERGRFPAIDVLRSVSRSLPNAATPEENQLLLRARAILRVYQDAELMVRAGLYSAGSDPAVDEALQVWPKLDAFIGQIVDKDDLNGGNPPSIPYDRLAAILDVAQAAPQSAGNESVSA